ncbi:MAG: TlpA disulfide reductase family protein [Candidatus Cohnella colombiensis]|uniref:TlpA disulfide reductase family protein n=1 Tax=Candidatus Cohnella colombiensis TaxID=3121368 RepID=A0AA95EXU9_9BACL|nr:MAG: TlpA disulfide reductase family protein [Cohnella sp.]
MRKNGIAIMAILLLITWGIYDYMKDRSDASDFNQQQQTSNKVGIKKSNEAPEFELLSLDNQPMKLSEFRGKKVILNFWATWCPPCRAEMPHMEKFNNEYKEDAVVLAVNLTNTEKKRSDVTEFLEQFNVDFPVVMDGEGHVASTYQVIAYPTSYIIDSQGIIREIYQGAVNYEVLKKAIERID